MGMHDHYALILGIGAALLVAVVLGYVFDRLRLPPILGQMLGGFVIGSLLFPVVHRQLPGVTPYLPNFTNITFQVIGTLGLVLLMFLTGLETPEKDLMRSGKHSLITAIGGLILPLGAGTALGYGIGWSFKQSVTLGLVMAPTSIGITAVTLVSLNRLRTREGLTLMGAAVLDDVMVIIAVSIVLASGSIGILAGKILGFFLLIWVLGQFVLPHLASAGYKITLKGGGSAVILAICIFAAVMAESLKVAAVTGAFLAGMFLAASPVKPRILRDVETIGTSFFIPLFFFLVGVKIDPTVVTQPAYLLFLVIGVSLLTKVGGAFLGAWISGLTKHQSLAIGVGAAPRMEFPIIVALLSIMNGIFTEDSAQALLGFTMAIVVASVILTPLLLRWVFARDHDIVQVHEHHV
jgi:Kef-type K+ transport system membrane component KefB